MREEERRARIMAAVAEPDTTAGAGELAQRLCRFAVDEMALSECALVLMPAAESASVLAGTGRHARTVTRLQMDLGEGPCLQAHGDRKRPIRSMSTGQAHACLGGKRAARMTQVMR